MSNSGIGPLRGIKERYFTKRTSSTCKPPLRPPLRRRGAIEEELRPEMFVEALLEENMFLGFCTVVTGLDRNIAIPTSTSGPEPVVQGEGGGGQDCRDLYDGAGRHSAEKPVGLLGRLRQRPNLPPRIWWSGSG